MIIVFSGFMKYSLSPLQLKFRFKRFYWGLNAHILSLVSVIYDGFEEIFIELRDLWVDCV